MSEQELYEVARKRIDRRNRRWTLWAVDLGILILTLALVALMSSTATAALFLGWIGVFVFHTVVLAMSESRDKDIEKEVAKLREAVYEKPKRLELNEDGELAEPTEWEYEDAQRSRHS